MSFDNLTLNEIKSVSVKLIPPNKEFELNDDEIKEFINKLKDIVIYNREYSHLVSGGQVVIFTISKKDGTIISVNACNSYLMINDKSYKTEYEPCEKLSSFANECLRIRE